MNVWLGGLYGRMIGRLLVDQFGIQTHKYWAWMDPGNMYTVHCTLNINGGFL